MRFPRLLLAPVRMPSEQPRSGFAPPAEPERASFAGADRYRCGVPGNVVRGRSGIRRSAPIRPFPIVSPAESLHL